MTEWHLTMQATNAKNLTELRKRFNSVDHVNGYTIFNIGGNNYRKKRFNISADFFVK